MKVGARDPRASLLELERPHGRAPARPPQQLRRLLQPALGTPMRQCHPPHQSCRHRELPTPR
eukprot:scaffold151823_cov23-Tisochrysis_lutea.AAC.2